MTRMAPQAAGSTSSSPGAAVLVALLFWLMFVVGAVCMGACLVLPAWVEYQSAHDQLAQATARNAELQRALHARQLQIAHHQHDPEYNERFVHREFNVQRPDRVTIVLDQPRDELDGAPIDNGAEPQPPASLVERVDRWGRSNPLLSVFVMDQTRRAVMVLSAVLLGGSLLLLGGSRGMRPQKSVDQPEALR